MSDEEGTHDVTIRWKVPGWFVSQLLMDAFTAHRGVCLGTWAERADIPVMTHRDLWYAVHLVNADGEPMIANHGAVIRGIQMALDRGYMQISTALVKDQPYLIDALALDAIMQYGLTGRFDQPPVG